MNASYSVRLLLLVGEVFFLVYFSLGILLKLTTPRVVRLAERWHPDRAAKLLAWLRMVPALGSGLALAVCVPAYLLLEQDGGAERAGWWCLFLVLASLCVCCSSAFQTIRALFNSRLYLKKCRLVGDQRSGVLVIPGDAPLLAVAGLWRPVPIATAKLIELFPEEELHLALRHEAAHASNHDNWKRLLFVASPSFPGSKNLELVWHHFAELAADDYAVAGDAHSGVALASALVRAAKYRAAPVPCLLASYFITQKDELVARVNRLLNASAISAPVEKGDPSTIWVGAIFALLILFASASQMESIHLLLETSFR